MESSMTFLLQMMIFVIIFIMALIVGIYIYLESKNENKKTETRQRLERIEEYLKNHPDLNGYDDYIDLDDDNDDGPIKRL